MKVMFLHGLDTGPHGRKYHALVEAFGEDYVLAPDTTGIKDPLARFQVLYQTLTDTDGPLVLLGSSFGGLMAVMAADSFPDKVKGIVLACPALTTAYMRFWGGLWPDCPIVIVHGHQDDVVPLRCSQLYARGRGAALVTVDDDHSLAASTDRLVFEVGFMGASAM